VFASKKRVAMAEIRPSLRHIQRNATVKRKPTRRDLLIVVGRLQGLVGHALSRNHDRNPNRQAEVDGTLHEAVRLCIVARSYDPPLKDSGPWADDSPMPEFT
jgi:hypothetical protein